MKIEKNESDDLLYKEALFEGDAWLQRNQHIIDSMTISHEVIRWNKWLDHPDYAVERNKIEQAYEKTEEFKLAIDSNIKKFLDRYQLRKKSHIDYNEAFIFCLNYLKEECACMCLWPKEGFHFEVYPTGRNEAMNKTYEFFIKPFMPDLLKSVSLRFKKYVKQNNSALIEA